MYQCSSCGNRFSIEEIELGFISNKCIYCKIIDNELTKEELEKIELEDDKIIDFLSKKIYNIIRITAKIYKKEEQPLNKSVKCISKTIKFSNKLTKEISEYVKKLE